MRADVQRPLFDMRMTSADGAAAPRAKRHPPHWWRSAAIEKELPSGPVGSDPSAASHSSDVFVGRCTLPMRLRLTLSPYDSPSVWL